MIFAEVARVLGGTDVNKPRSTIYLLCCKIAIGHPRDTQGDPRVSQINIDLDNGAQRGAIVPLQGMKCYVPKFGMVTEIRC